MTKERYKELVHRAFHELSVHVKASEVDDLLEARAVALCQVIVSPEESASINTAVEIADGMGARR